MKVNSKKLKNFVLISSALFSLSSCNLLGFMDKPSGDAQLLEAARACLDKGDFTCARDYYQALSNSYADVKVSETSLTTLGENNIFFMADLFEALGSGTGGANSLVTLAETLAARSKTDATTRTTIQTIYANEAAITDSTLKAYSQLISSLSMFSSLLASAVGADGKLTASDIVIDPTACKAANCTTTVTTECNMPVGSSLVNEDASEVTDLATSTNWNSSNSISKIKFAASAADTAVSTLTSSSGSGIFSALNALGGLGGGATAAAARCSRQALITTLFP
jgi:hypothetical protein